MSGVPDYVRHEDPATDRIMLAAWLVAQDEEIGYRIARSAAPGVDVAEVDLNVNITADYFRDIELCQGDPEAYACGALIPRPSGMTWAQWAEGEIESMIAEARRTAERLANRDWAARELASLAVPS